MNTLDALNWRYATKQFSDKKISAEDLSYILEAGNLAPTAFGLQPFSFIAIESEETKKNLLEASYSQMHAVDNSHLVVIAVSTKLDEAYVDEYITRMSRIRSIPLEQLEGFRNSMNGALTKRSPEANLAWAQKQAYIALGTMIIAASERGIDNHAMEGFDPNKYNDILGLNDKNLHVTVILALGYRSPLDESQQYAKVRKPIDDIVINM